MRSILVITRLTFLESVRRRIAIAAFILGLLFLILFATGFHYIHKETMPRDAHPGSTLIRNQVFNFFSTAALYAVNFLTIVMAALIAADTLAGEISSGVIQTIASKPMRRWEIVMGKWIGFAAMLALYLVLMAGGVLLIVYLKSGYHLQNIPAGVSLIYLGSLIMMSISLACSSRFSTLATGAIVFGLYGVGFIGGWMEQLGSAFKNQTAVSIGIFSSLLIPTEAVWKRASYEMASPLIRSLGIEAGPFGASSVPNPMMILYAVIYTAAMVALAVRHFSRRDL